MSGGHIDDRQECQPEDAGGVHGESNVFGFVDVFWILAGFKGVD